MTKSLLLFLCISSSLFFTPTKNWELKTEKDGIQVFTRQGTDSNFKEVRIQFTVNSEMDELLTLLSDVPTYTDWVYKCINSKELERKDGNSYVYYVETDMPFPMQNRDLVVNSQQWKNPQTGVVSSKSTAAPNRIEKKSGIVRISAYESSWRIEPLNNGTIYIDYQVKTDPGGSLPAWLVNMGVTIGPIKTMQSLRAALKDE